MSDRLEHIKARLASTEPTEGNLFGEFLSREQLLTDIDWLVSEVESLRFAVRAAYIKLEQVTGTPYLSADAERP